MNNKTWRIKHNDGTITETVSAPNLTEAMKLLGTKSLFNIQVFENGAWKWAF